MLDILRMLENDGRLTAEQLADTIHAHPSLPEAVLDAAEDALGHPIHA